MVAHPETGQKDSEGGFPHAPHLRVVEEALLAVRRAAWDLSFYPAGHPTLRRSLEGVTTHLRQALELEETLSLTIGRDGITHHLGEVGRANPFVRSLAAELFLARLRRIHIQRGFAAEELGAFLGLLATDPRKILLAGGPKAILTAAHVRHIQVDPLHYHTVREEETGRAGGELREGPTQTSEVGADHGESLGRATAAAEHLLRASHDPGTMEDQPLSLEEILARLDVAGGPEYRRLARRLELVARDALREGEIGQLRRLLEVMTRHRDDAARPPDIRLAAAQWLEGMVQAGALDFLVDKVCQKEVAGGEEILHILALLGELAADALLLRLSLEESMSARRRLLAAVVRLGDRAVPQALRGLEDERWFVVRNMALVLREVGDQSALDALARHLRHPDARVRREVARAIARLGGRHAPRSLRACLADADPWVRRTAIECLGAARDPLALRPLLALAERRAHEESEEEVRRAAILALGQIGNRSAVPLLARLVRKGSRLRGAKSEEVRIAAATALGQLGGPEAVETLRRAQRGGGRLGEACRAALARLGA